MQFGDAYLQASQDAYADPCPLPKAPTVAKSTSELDCSAKEEAGLMNDVLFYIMWPSACALLTSGTMMHYGKKASQWRHSVGNVLLENLESMP